MRKAKKAMSAMLVAAMLLSLVVVTLAAGETSSYPGSGKLSGKAVNFTVKADPAKPVPGGDCWLVTFHIFVESANNVPIRAFSFNLEPSEGLELADTARSSAQEANFYYDYPTPQLIRDVRNPNGLYGEFAYSNNPANPMYFAAAGSNEGEGITSKTEVFTIVGKVMQPGAYTLKLTKVVAGDGNTSDGVADQFKRVVTSASVTVGEITAKATVSGTAVSWNNVDDAVYYLYPSATDDETIRTEWKDGNCAGMACSSTESIIANADGKRYDQTFRFADVPYGDYKLAICKPGKYVPKIVAIAASEEDISLGEIKLWLYGDVNYSGIVDATDATQTLRYFNGKTPNAFTSGSEQDKADRLLCADINGDGSITGTDVTQMRRYFNSKAPNAFENFN